MSLTIRKSTDENKWLRGQIAARWPQTTKEANGGVYLTVALADMVLEAAIGLDHEQVQARLDHMRRSHRPLDQYPGHARIRESLDSLRAATMAQEASTVGADHREAVRRLLQAPTPIVGVLPGDPEASEHTRYWLERAGRLLLHLAAKASDSVDDVHIWHGQACPPPKPLLHDPHFGKSAPQHHDGRTAFLDAAANVCHYLGWDRVGFDGGPYRGKQLFALFNRKDYQGQGFKRTGDGARVRFYQHGDLRELDRVNRIDFRAITDEANERRRVRAIADAKGI